MHTSLLFLCSFLACVTQNLRGAEEQRGSTNRVHAVQSLCAKLGIGPGAVIADVGCGDGPDTMVFAAVVGERGTVFAQDIDPDRLKKVVGTADQKGFHNVVAVLGQSDDPRLPDGFSDLIYMNRVFHHFSAPREMLKRMWVDLKPGGYLVVVDQQKGPLTDWTPVEKREKEHHWTGETTVVRLAREAGFLFYDVLDRLWHEKEPFVLVFRRPANVQEPAGDPDPAQPLDASAIVQELPLSELGTNTAFFCGLDKGRAVLPVLKSKLPDATQVFDLLPEEWALSSEELPSNAPLAGVEVLRTHRSDVAFPEGGCPRLVLFVDAYHRLWDPAPLLRHLKQQMPGSILLAVVDRKGPDGELRRLAGHHRRISSKLVVEEMRQKGFELQQTLSPPVDDRFFLLFGLKSPTGDGQPRSEK